MKTLIAATALALLAACGLESAGTAATSAAIKKQELEQHKNTVQQAEQKVNAALQAEQQRSDPDAEK